APTTPNTVAPNTMSKVTRPCSSRQRAIPHFALLLLGDCDTTEVDLDARSGDERYAPCLGSWLVIVDLEKVGISIDALLDPLPDRLWIEERVNAYADFLKVHNHEPAPKAWGISLVAGPGVEVDFGSIAVAKQ